MCSILTGLKKCVLFSQDCSFVSYSHRAKKMCPILTGLKIGHIREIGHKW